jgi:hypothetical protein
MKEFLRILNLVGFEYAELTKHEAIAFILEEHEEVTIRHAPVLIFNTGREKADHVSGKTEQQDPDVLGVRDRPTVG